MALTELVKQIEEASKDLDLSFINKYDFQDIVEAKYWLLNVRYYRMLMATCKVLRPKHSLELGCWFGGSAMMLAQYSEKVTTCDIRDQARDRRVFTDYNIEHVIFNNPCDCEKMDWNKYDLIFIDIGLHSGEHEEKIHQELSQKYKGLVLWDDIFYTDRIKNLWNSISQEKLETDWHETTGFGVVNYV